MIKNKQDKETIDQYPNLKKALDDYIKNDHPADLDLKDLVSILIGTTVGVGIIYSKLSNRVKKLEERLEENENDN